MVQQHLHYVQIPNTIERGLAIVVLQVGVRSCFEQNFHYFDVSFVGRRMQSCCPYAVSPIHVGLAFQQDFDYLSVPLGSGDVQRR